MAPKGPQLRTVAKSLFTVGTKADITKHGMLVAEMQQWRQSADPDLLEQLHLIIKNDWIKFIVAHMSQA